MGIEMNDTIIKGGRGICGAVLVLLSLGAGGCMSGGGRHGKYTAEAAKKLNESKERMDAASAYEKATQLFTMGNLSEALEQVDASLAMKSNVMDANLLRLQILIELDRGQDEITAAAESGLRQWPEEARFVYYLGVYNERQGKIDKALECYLKAAAIDTNNVQYEMAAAEMYIEAADISQAKAFLAGAVKKHPNAPGLLQNLGYIAQMEGNDKEAKKYFLEAFSLAPEESALQENLATVYYRLADYDEALPLFEKLLAEKSYKDRNDLKIMTVRTCLRSHKPVEAKDILSSMLEDPDCDRLIAWKEMLNVALMLDDMLLGEEAADQLQRIAAGSETAVLAEAVVEHKKGDIEAVKNILQGYNGKKSDIFKRYEKSLTLQ